MRRLARPLTLIAALATAALVAGCSSAPPPPAAASSASVASTPTGPSSDNSPADSTGEGTGSETPSDAGTDSSAAGSSGAALPVPDPCQVLSKADVQVFFTVPIATALPSAFNGPNTKGCEWADNSPGVHTTIAVVMATGDDAQTRLLLTNNSPAASKVSVPGVGDQADHAKGDPSLTSFKGSGASLEFCGITTTGITNLVPNQKLVPGNITDEQATTVAEQYGTLCNKIFGSGNTTPTMTAAAPTGATGASSSAPKGPVLADGGTMPGSKIPLPVGLDCSGSKTAPDSFSELTCTTTATGTTTPEAIYSYFLSALPAHGYAINHETEEHANGQEVAVINFSGNDGGMFSAISIRGAHVSISLNMH